MKSLTTCLCICLSLTLMAGPTRADQEAAAEQQTEQAKEPVRHWRLVTGQQYAQMEPGPRQTYVAGLSDAFNLMRTQSSEYEWIVKCSINVQAPQLQTMFENWLKDHQDRWQNAASRLYLMALRENCEARAQQQQPQQQQ